MEPAKSTDIQACALGLIRATIQEISQNKARLSDSFLIALHRHDMKTQAMALRYLDFIADEMERGIYAIGRK